MPLKQLELDVEEVVADMFGQAAIRKQRQSCACKKPMPGVFDRFSWTTCQKCCCQLSMKTCAERGAFSHI